MGLEVAGWFASAAISGLSALVSSYIREQYKYQTGAKRKLKSMEQSLGRIKPVIDVVERRGVEEETGLLSWLNDLKDAAYDAEDILDLFEYQSLRDKVESRNWVKSLKTACKRLTFSDDSLNQLCDVVNKFDDLAKDGRIDTFLKVVELCTDTHREDTLLEDRETTPICVEPTVFGRTKQVEELLNYLLVSFDAPGSNSDNFSVVSIVGLGGVGKTTLAQSVYHDQNVMDHFDFMAWAWISCGFNITKVTTDIMVSASNPKHEGDSSKNEALRGVTNLSKIQDYLINKLKGKRFLIVLDDMWGNKATACWDILKSLFRNGKEGSRVVVTTREDKVAEAVESTRKMKLEGLEEEEYWKFFRCCAFGDVHPEEHKKLEHIGQEIAKNLGGLPLAAKTVGAVLKSRLEEKHWRDVLQNKLWKNIDNKNGILPSLKLSYDHLPGHLKQCFVYCALFPKHYYFNKDRLVHIWVALGYIRLSNGNKNTLEGVGEGYFDELVSKSFFQKVENKSYYVIHDLLHDLAESIGADEVYRQEEDNLVKLSIPKTVRHLFLRCTNLNRILDQIQDTKRLRSLVHDPPRGTNKISEAELETTFKKLPGLRVLIVGEYYESSPLADTIDRMVHLRYLEFPSGTTLPVSLCKLYHLQVLALFQEDGLFAGIIYLSDPPFPFYHPWNRKSKARIFTKLINLRYIYALRSRVSAIPGIGKLSSLQILNHYNVGVEKGHKISELGDLEQIRGSLRIVDLDNVKNKEEASKAKLNNKEQLDELELWWDGNHGGHEMVLEGLQPHYHLNSLEITGYMGIEHPSWFNKTCLSNIEDITLSKCQRLTTLPPLGELPYLKTLHLEELSSLQEIGVETYGEGQQGGVFQSLEELTMWNMKALRKWSALDRILLPKLRRLDITECPKFEVPIPFHSSPEGLKVGFGEHVDDISVLTRYIPESSRSSLQSLSIHNMGGVEAFTVEQQEWFQSLTSLKQLTFFNCTNLRSLPDVLGSLTSLEDLRIYGCPNMVPLGENRLPTCLKGLHIRGVSGELRKRYDWRLGGSEWNKIAHVPPHQI